MFSNPVDNLIEPVWRRFARCAVCVVVGVGAVTLLIAVLSFLHPVLP
jgi:putative copper export protein